MPTPVPIPLPTSTLAPAAAPGSPDTPPAPRAPGWFGAFLLRIHFYAGVFVGPFILVAALSGALYAVTPQIEQLVYAHELHAPVAGSSLPLAEQIAAATAVVGGGDGPVAVRPAPHPGDTTRVMFAADGLLEGQTRAIFVDPGTAQVRGDLTAYGTSGALPLRAWLDELHRNLHLGEPGRIYSELAASWLGIIVLAGLGLWVRRIRRTRVRRDRLRPNLAARGYRRLFSLHTASGIWLLAGALFLSATGITWSQYAGQNVAALRTAFDVGTPAVSTDLAGPAAGAADPHAGHGAGVPAPAAADPAGFDAVLAVARGVNVNTGLVEIQPPAAAGQAWVVQEIQRSFPTEVDAVAVDGDTLVVTDRVDFARFNLVSKLARWGIDLHMGSLFGLANQVALFVIGVGVAGMVVWGYLLWWTRRPVRSARLPGKPPAGGALVRAPWWGILAVIVGAIAVGLFLPLVGISLLGFIVVDGLLALRRPTRPRPARGISAH